MTTNTTSLNPAAVQAQVNLWYPTMLFIGGAIWHGVLKISPWAKANGGLLRGVINFFWTKQPPKP